MNDYEVLHSEFNIETHKKTFIHYLEVVILENGKVVYAVPSHQELAIKLYMQKYKINTREELWNIIPLWEDVMLWFCNKLHLVFVWTDFYKGNLNDNQLETLKILQNEGLYEGEIHD